MKNKILLTSICFLLLVFFTSCTKETDLNEEIETYSRINLEGIDFSVDNNTLVFESEASFNQFLNFLNIIGNSKFDEFEEAAGFESLRRTSKKPLAYSKIQDPLISTIINPNCEIVISGYKFRIDLENEITEVSNYGESFFRSVNIESNEPLKLSWDDNFFEIMEKGNLKSSDYCRTEKDKFKDWEFEKGTVFYKKLKAKVCFQRFTFINTIIVKFITEEFSGGDIEFHVRCNAHTFKYKRKGESEKDVSFDRSMYFNAPGQKIFERPFWGTTRVEKYHVIADFYILAPELYNGIPDSTTLEIMCNY